MAFPQVQTTNTASNANTTSHTVNLPTGITSGDLLIAVGSIDAVETTTWPAGWDPLVDEVNGGTVMTCDVFYRDADGTEGSTITVTTGTSEHSNWEVWRIDGHDSASPPEATSSAPGSTSTPDRRVKLQAGAVTIICSSLAYVTMTVEQPSAPTRRTTATTRTTSKTAHQAARGSVWRRASWQATTTTPAHLRLVRVRIVSCSRLS